MFRRRKRMQDNPTEPELPITPMLDMSFQLMAFFILTFKSGPTEGQLALLLPREGNSTPDVVSLNPVQEVKHVGEVRLVGTTIDFTLVLDGVPPRRRIAVSEDKKDANGQPAPLVSSSAGGTLVNTDVMVYELRKIMDAAKAANADLPTGVEKLPLPKLEFQFEDEVRYELVIRFVDDAKRAGFQKVIPMPLATGPK